MHELVELTEVPARIVQVLDDMTERDRVEAAAALLGMQIGDGSLRDREPCLSRLRDRGGIWIDSLRLPSERLHVGQEGAAPTSDVKEPSSPVRGKVPDLPGYDRAAGGGDACDQAAAGHDWSFGVAEAGPAMVVGEPLPERAHDRRWSGLSMCVIGPIREFDGLQARARVEVRGGTTTTPVERPATGRHAKRAVTQPAEGHEPVRASADRARRHRLQTVDRPLTGRLRCRGCGSC